MPKKKKEKKYIKMRTINFPGVEDTIFQIESSHQVSKTKDGEGLHFCGLHQRQLGQKDAKRQR